MVAVTAPGAMELKRMDVGIQTGQGRCPTRSEDCVPLLSTLPTVGRLHPGRSGGPVLHFPGHKGNREAGPDGPGPVPRWVLAFAWRNPS